jgi:N6-adenosine-specific RNA methylase IME4
MSIAEIEAMPVSSVADKDCRLWLWTTNRYLPAAFGVMAAWGFDYRQTLVWHKADGNMGGSVAPNSAEFLLVGVRGRPRRLCKLKSAVWKFPQSKRHSRKPEAFQDMVETVSPSPHLELFARRQRENWTCWGNEVDTANDTGMVVWHCSTCGAGGAPSTSSTSEPAIDPTDPHGTQRR